MAYEVGHEKCARKGCKSTYVPHRWGTMEASKLGWFLQRDGTAWCPKHIPDWVAEWRSKKSREGKS